jgi:hypothetical protein
MRKTFLRWVAEANFLIKLGNCELQGIAHFANKRKVKALAQMMMFAKKASFERTKRL